MGLQCVRIRAFNPIHEVIPQNKQKNKIFNLGE